MKIRLRNGDVLAIAALIIFGQQFFFTGSPWSLVAIGVLVVVWSWWS
jgi:hypothetical protein